MECSRGAALVAISHLRDRLAAAAGEGLDRCVTVRVMLDGRGAECIDEPPSGLTVPS